MYALIFRNMRVARRTKVTVKTEPIERKSRSKRKGKRATRVKIKTEARTKRRRSTRNVRGKAKQKIVSKAKVYSTTSNVNTASANVNVNVSKPEPPVTVPSVPDNNNNKTGRKPEPVQDSLLSRTARLLGRAALPVATGAALNLIGVPAPISGAVSGFMTNVASGPTASQPGSDPPPPPPTDGPGPNFDPIFVPPPETSSWWQTLIPTVTGAAIYRWLSKRGGGFDPYYGHRDKRKRRHVSHITITRKVRKRRQRYTFVPQPRSRTQMIYKPHLVLMGTKMPQVAMQPHVVPFNPEIMYPNPEIPQNHMPQELYPSGHGYEELYQTPLTSPVQSPIRVRSPEPHNMHHLRDVGSVYDDVLPEEEISPDESSQAHSPPPPPPGPPPPPPPPLPEGGIFPPVQFSRRSHDEGDYETQSGAQSQKAQDTHALFLQELTQGIKLKPTNQRKSKLEAPVDEQTAFMRELQSAIKQPKLRKAPPIVRRPTIRTLTPAEEMFGSIEDLMLARRNALAPIDEDHSRYSDDEWLTHT